MMTGRFMRMGLGLVLASIFAQAQVNAQAQSRPDFTGRWELNLRRSDIPAGVRVSGGHFRTLPAAGREGAEFVAVSLPLRRVLRIRHAEPEFTVLWLESKEAEGGGRVAPGVAPASVRGRAAPDGGGRLTPAVSAPDTFYTDGRVVEQTAGDEAAATSAARWEADRLVTELKTPGGLNITETYELAPDSRSLYVTLRIEGESLHAPVVLRKVYDATPQLD